MSMPSCYKKRGGVRGGATHIHKRKLSSEPHVKKRYKLGNHHFYNPAFFLDVICRWNAARSSGALTDSVSKLRCYDFKLQNRLNRLTTSVLGQPIDRNFQPSANYIGELLGVEYLYNKTGAIVEVIDIDK
jgi:hypothetical protein